MRLVRPVLNLKTKQMKKEQFNYQPKKRFYKKKWFKIILVILGIISGFPYDQLFLVRL